MHSFIKILLVLIITVTATRFLEASRVEKNVFSAEVIELERILPNLKSDSARYAVYRRLGLVTNSLQADTSAKYFEKAVYYARKIGDRDAAVLCMGMLANSFSKCGEYRRAIDTLKSANIQGEKYSCPANRIYIFSQLGKMYNTVGRYHKADVIFNKGKAIIDMPKIFAELKSKSVNHHISDNDAGNLLTNTVVFYLSYTQYLGDIGEIKSAIKETENYLPLLEFEYNLYPKYITALTNLAGWKRQLGDYETALELYQRARMVLDNNASPAVKKFSAQELDQLISDLYFKLHNYPAALSALLQSSPEVSPQVTQWKYSVKKAKILIALGNLSSAEKIIQKCREKASSATNDELIELYEDYRRLYAASGNYSLALEFYDKIEKLCVNSFFDYNVEAIASQLLLFKYSHREKALELKKENEVNKILWKQTIIWFAIVSVAIVTFILLFAYYIKKSYGYLKQLLEKNAKADYDLRELRQKNEICENEKNRLLDEITKKLQTEISYCSEEISQKSKTLNNQKL